ncbi:cation diffusion facilitator family transporter [Tepidibacillus fermentans]|uniref:Cation diffusion facilitator family transporter n=1 Tax=Tepidibacillus fermentans TaxID=1281767 RepID=A0A4R3KJX1_9BACI|nr:cation diffusion facilitator family transporter [Tepidibacillus fermentans]TCS83832.1 cation diffusion facilitator family transporter [Tepidibacillus fermentans]
MKEQRFQKAEYAAWVGIIGNLLLSLVKGVAGMIANSKALIADAAHSASDVAGSIAVLIGLRAAQLPPDKDHPYGHGKAENIAAIIVSVILFFVGVEVAYSSIRGLFQQHIEAPGMLAIYATILSIIVKESMFQYKYRVGKKINSPAVIANAWEHRSDVYSSIGALIGIGGAVFGGKYQIHWLLYLDPLAGAVVAIIILKMAYDLGRETIHNTLDRVLQEDETKEYVAAVEKVFGVMHVDELFAREHGHYVIVDLKIAVDPKITVEQGHQIGKEVKKTLLLQFHNVKDVFVHINPYQTTYYQKQSDEPFLIQ